MTRRFLPGFIIALGLLALGLLIAFTVGRYPVTPAELIEVLVSRLAGRPTELPPAVENVVLLVRGPRVVAAAVAIGTIVLIALRWRLNVMSLPEDEARALGLATGPFRIAIVAAATLVTSASVAASGIIGWVGLVVPHLARALVGPDFPRLIPTAALLGGGYLLFIDTLARTAAPVEIPLGILTAVIGTPFFIWLLAGMQRTWS